MGVPSIKPPRSPRALGDGETVMARVLIPHEPEAESVVELEVHMHDLVQLTGDPAPDGWLHARLGAAEGLVPADFVEIVDEDEDDEEEEGGEETGGGGQDGVGAEASHDDGQNDEEAGNMRICLTDFITEVGALNECTIRKGHKVMLIEDADMVVPEGWVYATNLDTDQTGYVPEDFLGIPRKDNLSEEGVLLQKSREEEKKLRERLEAQRVRSDELLEETRREKDHEIQQMTQLKEAEADERRKVADELNALKNSAFLVLKDEVRDLEERDAQRDKMAWVEEQQRVAREEAESVYGGTRSVLGRKKALEAAEGERAKAELEFNRIDAARAKAERKLLDAQRKVEERTEELHAEEAAREANERTLMLLPGLRELMAPTQVRNRTRIS